MVFLSLYVRGINNPLKDNAIKSEIIKNKVEIVGLTEINCLLVHKQKFFHYWEIDL